MRHGNKIRGGKGSWGSAGIGLVLWTCAAVVGGTQCGNADTTALSAAEVRRVFEKGSFVLSDGDAESILPDVRLALEAQCGHSPTGSNSKVKFAAVEIAAKLSLNPKTDPSVVSRISDVLAKFPCCSSGGRGAGCPVPTVSVKNEQWESYFSSVVGLTQDRDFLKVVNDRGFHPVKISWEDIGRYENSVWGDRISDVGIWVRKDEHDPESAELALSVRRDSNFRDKILVVPAERIKVHRREGGRTVEIALPERLKALGLTSRDRDRNVIVSNQFAIVPVPSKEMWQQSRREDPARAAFTFSIFPYGSTNFVITDVIEGSSEAVVGPGTHQLLFADIDGQKAPFTASRAEERADLMQLESDLKAQGMDVDVQRYYLIQVPLLKDASGIELSNMGTPPLRRVFGGIGDGGCINCGPVPAPVAAMSGAADEHAIVLRKKEGLSKVAIGHGDVEGPYRTGSGFAGKRAEEPIRVTVVYFVTPVGKVTESDMEHFAAAFKSWDEKAIWGGSFVTKDGKEKE